VTSGVPPDPASDVAAATRDLDALAAALQDRCLARSLTLAVAESCTGGLVAHAITRQPGASGYFLGGVVSYSNEVKIASLDVPANVLEQHGAVSAQVALAMATGVRSRLGATIGAGVTGVAGPDGGTEAKPVGLVYVAVADADGSEVRRFQWTGDRIANITLSAAAVLELLDARTAGATGEA
jgi:nicotinamide-nucleotide amidase